MNRSRKNLAEQFNGIKSDYAATVPSRFRRVRPGIFGSGDSHYANEWNFIRMREYVRDMDRNDAFVGQLVDRAVANQVQEGYLLKVDTGDPKLDDELFARWNEWAGDADVCDAAGEFTFPEMERMTARAEYIDGDIFALPLESGHIQLIEADRCRTPENTRRNVVHGVLLDERRRRLQFWFSKDNLNPYERIYRVTDMTQIDARDAEGNRNVFQIYKPSRVSQTRGVTAFHAIFDICGMVEDTNFATLVKQQMAACVAFFLQRSDTYQSDVRTGERRSDILDDSTTATTEGISPGQFIRGAKGEDLKVLAGQIPTNEYFAHIRLLLQIIGVNLGLPLVLVLLDGKESNFSGARVALDQARMGFRHEQIRRKRLFHEPAYRWKVRQFMADDPAILKVAKKSKIDVFGHRWDPPSWPYLQPVHDATADKIRSDNYLSSDRRIAAENGVNHREIVDEQIEDKSYAITAAIKRAKKISEETGVPLHWRDIYARSLPQGSTSTDTIADDRAIGTPANGAPDKGKKEPSDVQDEE